MGMKYAPQTYKLEDGTTASEGDRAYDYYSMKAGVISTFAGNLPDPWFDFVHDDGSVNVLNGQRVCSLEHARKMGWPGV